VPEQEDLEPTFDAKGPDRAQGQPDGVTEPDDGQANGQDVIAGEGRPRRHVDAENLTPGEVLLERFKILRSIGVGGMGHVYEARDLALQVRVAIKMMRASLVRDRRVLDHLRREVILARQVTHPNVCRIFEFYEVTHRETNLAFLTMELLVGQTLAHRIRVQGPLELESALPLFAQLADALAAIHVRGIVHRDFKSANVVLVESQPEVRCVVTDFGIARGTLVDMTGESYRSSDLDAAGTPAYMAPEQRQGMQVGPAADIYAFGVVVRETLTGSLPHATHAIRKLPRRLASVLDLALSMDPERRPQDPHQFLRLLQRSTRRPGTAIRVGLTASLLLLLGLAAIGASSRWKSRPEEVTPLVTSLDSDRLYAEALQRGAAYRFSEAKDPFPGGRSPEPGKLPYYWMSVDNPDVSTLVPGRPDVAPLDLDNPSDAMITLDLTNLAPWRQQGDMLELASQGANGHLFAGRPFDCPLPVPLAEGATSLEHFSVGLKTHPCSSFRNRVEGSKGDRLLVTQLEERTTARGQRYMTLVRYAQAEPFDLTDGQTYVFKGAFTTVKPGIPMSCHLLASQFAALLPQYPEGFEIYPVPPVMEMTLYVAAQSAPVAAGWVPGEQADLLIYTALGAEDVETGLMYFATPLPATVPYGAVRWAKYLYFAFPGTRSELRSQDRIPVGIEQTYREPGSMCTGPLVPRIEPVQAITINGLDASHSLSAVGLTPELAWTPPRIGSAKTYTLYIRAHMRDPAGRRTVSSGVATLTVREPKLRIPQGLLTPGGTYSVLIEASDSTALAAPVGSSQSWATTGVFTP